jgi:hypothetical protein
LPRSKNNWMNGRKRTKNNSIVVMKAANHALAWVAAFFIFVETRLRRAHQINDKSKSLLLYLCISLEVNAVDPASLVTDTKGKFYFSDMYPIHFVNLNEMNRLLPV